MKSDLGIVIVNWRSKQVILDCLESIWKAGYIKNVVVVDNASNDGSVERIKNYESRIKVIENSSNLGFAEGNNKGIKYLLERGVQYIFILNPDTEINKDTIPNLLEVMERDKRVGIVGPKVYSNSSTSEESRQLAGHHPRCLEGFANPGVSKPLVWSAGGVLDKKRYSGGLLGYGEIDRGQYDNLGTPSRSPFGHLEGALVVDYIPGTAMMVRREVLEKCGLFNPNYFIYYEDVELNLRARKAGFKLVFVPTSTIIHHESASMGKNSPSQEYYLARNHLLFVERNAPFGIKLRELVRLPKTLYEHWRKKELWAIRGIRNYLLRKFGRATYFDSSTPGESIRLPPRCFNV